MNDKFTVAFGPEMNRPSWEWIGFDVGRELSKYYNVIFFSQKTHLMQFPDANVAFYIKKEPDAKFLKIGKQRFERIVYCPVDNYKDLDKIHASTRILNQCDEILVHCERLVPIFKPYCNKVQFVEHHSRFTLAKMADYKPNGYVIWIGSSQNLPVVVKWLQEHSLGIEIKFVTDYQVSWKNRMRNVLPIKDDHEVIRWSPCAQRDLMSGAKAAFDIKGLDFHHMNKPPLKAQEFLVSGIPFAANPECYSVEYFKTRGFSMASPLERDRWLSRDYWEESQLFGKELQNELTLEKVGLRYRQIIDELLNFG